MADSTRPRVPIDLLQTLCRAAGDTDDAHAAQANRLLHHVIALHEFSERLGLETLDHLTPSVISAFLRSPQRDGSPASARLMQHRRTALRLALRLARAEGLVDGDPTADIVLPPRRPVAPRPLTDAEVERCRSEAMWALTDTRRATAWALAEATCRTSEIPHLTADDVDVDTGRLWIHGGKTTPDRWSQLTPWGLQQVRRRINLLDRVSDPRLVYRGKSIDAGQVSACAAVVDVLRRAGIANEPGVRPASVVGWAGRQILNETGRIDIVAQRIGVKRLDRVAELIGWDWSNAEARP